MRTTHQLAPLALALAAAGAAHAGKTDVNAAMQNAINGNAAAKAAVLRAIGISDPSKWTVTSVKVKKVKAVNMALQMPAHRLEYISSTEILNCGDTGTSRSITLAKEVTNSTTVTKSETLEVGAEVTVSGEYMGIGASATASTSYSMTNETQQSNSKTQRIEDTTTVTFDKEGGRISVLQANVLSAKMIPWTATFEPEDGDAVEVTATASGAGRMCIYEHSSYKGKSKCWNAPENDSWIGKSWNDEVTAIKLEGPVSVTIYEHKDYKGKSKRYTDSVANVGASWNDKLSSFKLQKDTKSGSPAYATFKAALPANARQFKASGAVSVSDTRVDGKRITNYVMRDEDVKAGCSNVPSMQVSAAKSAAPAPAGSGAPQAMKARAAKAAPNIIQRELPKEEAMRKIATARKL